MSKEAVEPEQKPVAWRGQHMHPNAVGKWVYIDGPDKPEPKIGGLIKLEPVFAHPVRSAQEAALRTLMAKLANLLDEDHFAECEEIVRMAGILPPGGETATPPAPVQHLRGPDGLNESAFEAARMAYHRTHLGDYGSLRAAIAAYLSAEREANRG